MFVDTVQYVEIARAFSQYHLLIIIESNVSNSAVYGDKNRPVCEIFLMLVEFVKRNTFRCIIKYNSPAAKVVAIYEEIISIFVIFWRSMKSISKNGSDFLKVHLTPFRTHIPALPISGESTGPAPPPWPSAPRVSQ